MVVNLYFEGFISCIYIQHVNISTVSNFFIFLSITVYSHLLKKLFHASVSEWDSVFASILHSLTATRSAQLSHLGSSPTPVGLAFPKRFKSFTI